jgi:hypothetical protein
MQMLQMQAESLGLGLELQIGGQDNSETPEEEESAHTRQEFCQFLSKNFYSDGNRIR